MAKKKTIAKELIEGFTELADTLEAGRDLGTKFDCYRMELDLKPHTYTSVLVKETRMLLGASQQVFAKFLGASVKTVSEWEQGRGTPRTMACRFMDEIRLHPEHYKRRLRESVIPKSGRR